VSALIEFVSNNALTSTLVGAAIVSLAGWLWRVRQNRRDSLAILRFLIQSGKETAHTFRSTEAIASATNLSEGRVADLCARHPKIRRNAKEKQSWRLVE